MSAGERMEVKRIADALKIAVGVADGKKPGKKERRVISLAKELEAMSGGGRE